MITASHALIYTPQAEAVRACFRDVLGVSHVDAGQGWLIFALLPAELGIHPAGEGAPNGSHELYLMCDDVEATMRELSAKGVEFAWPVTDQGWGRVTAITLPRGMELG